MSSTSQVKPRRIYLDNAASTPMYPEVIQEMSRLMQEFFGNPSSVHYFGRHAKNTIEEARKIIATGLGASQGEIFFTSGGTEANNTALKCAVRDLGVERIISSAIEHHSVLHSCHRLAAEGIQVDYVDLDGVGRPKYQHLKQLLSSDSRKTLVSLMHGNNEIGTMINLQKIGALTTQYEALFHTDAVQTVGHFPFELSALNVNFLSASAHKFHGPKGVGILYINENNPIQPYIDGGGQERNLRAGTENIAGIRAMATAFQISSEHMDQANAHIQWLKTRTKQALNQNFPGIRYNGDHEGECLFTVLSVTFPESAIGDLLLLNLDIEGISTSGGSACSSGAAKGSHVLSTLNPNQSGATIRISFSEYNTEEEVDLLIEKLIKILQ